MVNSVASAALWLGAFATTALGHGLITQWTVNGAKQQGFLLDYYYMKVNGQTPPKVAAWYAENLDIGFVEPNQYGSADINCHKNSIPGALTIPVAAGSTVETYWNSSGGAWPHPYGPVVDYVANCNGDCAKVDKNSLKWVKIQAKGINYSTQKWASGDLIVSNCLPYDPATDAGNRWKTVIPKSLAPGNYVLRTEIIALHGATSQNGAQNYPQCFNIQITGSGTAKPAGTSGTALYKSTDPGILFNPYQTINNYVMPGPALFTG